MQAKIKMEIRGFATRRNREGRETRVCTAIVRQGQGRESLQDIRLKDMDSSLSKRKKGEEIEQWVKILAVDRDRFYLMESDALSL
jgi:hypothetical protein